MIYSARVWNETSLKLESLESCRNMAHREQKDRGAGMGSSPYQLDCGDSDFPSMPAELLVAAGDDAIEHIPTLFPYQVC